MPYFVYKGINSYGEKRKGKIEAVNLASAQSLLKKMRITPSMVKEAPKDLFAELSFLQPKVTGKDVVIFTRQLSTMIDAGLPLVQSLEILTKQQENVTFKKVLLAVRTDVESGSTIAEAMKKHPDVFDNLYCNMIDAGEVGGILDTILSRLAAYMEKNMALVKKVKGAMTYPVICLCISFVVMAVMLIFVVPVFQKMFADFNSALPVPTQMVVDMSEFAKGNFHFMIGGFFAVIWSVKKINKTEKGKMQIDRLLLVFPIIGPLMRRVAVAKFTRTLSTMMASGVPILEALNVVAKTAGNKVIETAVFRVTDAIKEGRPLAEPLEETAVFPSMVVQMINVGESTGALDVMLEKIADFYDDEVDQAVENLTAAIEPLMMVVLGGMIGGLVVAMYLPIFSMAGAVGG
ncbi:MAG: type II secretion system F family protein [Proteobacteria bacterium]|nr:type II secretion system F family protein [Desulfobulbaceae bacterium]MBU4151692.1 type II secretion system F family protein [Pseudomonadota bacterium]